MARTCGQTLTDVSTPLKKTLDLDKGGAKRRSTETIVCVLRYIDQQLNAGVDIAKIDAGPKQNASKLGRHGKLTENDLQKCTHLLTYGCGLDLTTCIIIEERR